MDKIISVVPSITLTLFDLGLEDNIIGRTKFCIHPEDKVGKIPTIGGTKNLNIEKIRELAPDLIIANKEENEKEQIEMLQKEFNVWVTDIENIDDNYAMIAELGARTGTVTIAKEIIETTRQNFKTIGTSAHQTIGTSAHHTIGTSDNRHISTLYLIWRKPYMSIGRDTFIHSMLETIGLKNVLENETRYPNLGDQLTVDCDLVLLSSEPYPFTEKHIAEIQAQLPKARVLLADGEFFSWYGSKMIGAPAYFSELLQKIHTG